LSNKPEELTARGLERRCKRHLIGKTHDFFAITTPGFEHTVSSEITTLECADVKQVLSGGVEFSAPFESVYDCNLMLRTANRILLRIDSFTARSYPELYNKARRIPWEIYCGFSRKVSVTVSSKHSRLHHTGNIEQAVLDALTEHMKSLGVMVQPEPDASICFHIRFSDDICTISVDSSGELLYKRGYRINTAHAPIRETIAAAILMEAQWNRYACIADPMCGSGTFLLEAAQLALHRAPGYSRSFAFQSWPSFSETHFKIGLKKCDGHIRTTPSIKLVGSDIDKSSVKAVTENAERLGVLEMLSLSVGDCMNFNVSGEYGSKGLLVSNLPYGKRVGAADNTIRDFIKEFSVTLRKSCRGWNFALVSAHEQFENLSALKVQKKIPFVNGGIPVAVYMGKV
jgi:putative N6-adenine-specific DNA methylase